MKAKPKAASRERQNPRKDEGFGIEKVIPPYFIEVELRVPFEVVAARLKAYGRSFPRDNEIVQVAHLLSKRDRFYLCHFKSLLWLDGVIDEEAISRRDIEELKGAAKTLVSANYVETKGIVGSPRNLPPHVKDCYGDGKDWRYVSKYTFKRAH